MQILQLHDTDFFIGNTFAGANMTTATIGTISHGTMRAIDLVDAFADELRRLDTDGAHKDLIAECDSWLASGTEDEDPCEETGGDLVEALFDALNEFAPPYCYFGAHEGDGSDYGFWPSIDALEDDARSGGVLKVDDTSDVPDDYEGAVMHVNDHGNVTLYSVTDGKFTEIWGCV